MAVKKEYIVGFLIVTILSGIFYVSFPKYGLKMRIDIEKTTFYVKEGSYWYTAGTEYNSLYNGSKKLTILTGYKNVTYLIDNITSKIIATRNTTYSNGARIIDTYEFDGTLDSAETFPVSHKVEVINGKGLFYRYDVKNLEYSGETRKLNGVETSMNFGKNMKVTWWSGYSLGYVYSSGSMYVKSKKIDSDYQTFDVRLFDPSGNYCYQGTANQTSACGGLSTGRYYIYGGWAYHPNEIDENYSSYATSDVSPAYMYINYTKPANSSNSSLWQIKDEAGFVNVSFPSNCWSQSLLQLFVTSNVGGAVGKKLNWTCFNGVSFQTMRNSTQYDMFEEGIWWFLESANFTINDCTDITSPGAYTLTSNIDNPTSNCIRVLSDDVSIYCNGYSISGSSSASNAILVQKTDNTQLKNITINGCFITNWDNGLYVFNTTASLFNNLTINGVLGDSQFGRGIFMYYGGNSTFKNISIGGNDDARDGIYFLYSSDNYVYNLTTERVTASGLRIYDSNHIYVYNATLDSSWHYDFFLFSSSVAYCDNKLVSVKGTKGYPIELYNYSISLSNAEYSNLVLCDASGSNLTNIRMDQRNGDVNKERNYISVISTNNSKFDKINVTQSYGGIWFRNSHFNTINNSIFSKLQYESIQLTSSNNNTITNTTFYYNDADLGSQCGNAFYMTSNPKDNKIYNNRFVDNGQYSAGFHCKPILFDNQNSNKTFNSFNTSNSSGTPIYGSGNRIGGNYWSNNSGTGYSDTCTDSDSDGFCDKPYDAVYLSNCTAGVSCSNNTDYLPLHFVASSNLIYTYDGYADSNYTNFDINPEYIFDENYSTEGYCTGTCYATMNYSRPVWATNNTKYQQKGVVNSLTLVNDTLPYKCFVQNPIQIRFNAVYGVSTMNSTCYNGSNWILIYTYSPGTGVLPAIYEEGMYWEGEPDTTPPVDVSWTNNGTVATTKGGHILYNGILTDDFNLSYVTLVTSISCTVLDYTKNYNFSGTYYAINITANVTQNYGCNVPAYLIMYDSSGNHDTTTVSYFIVYDVTKPNSTGLNNNASTYYSKVGTSVKFNVTLADNNNLSAYIFSTNKTGSWVNSSSVAISGTSYIANVTESLSGLTSGRYVCGKFYINDTANLKNETLNTCFYIVDSNAPGYSSFTNNASSMITNGTSVNWSISYTEMGGGNLSNSIFYNNFTKTNKSVTLSGTTATSSGNVSFSGVQKNQKYCGKFYVNDTKNNWNETTDSCVTITGSDLGGDATITIYLDDLASLRKYEEFTTANIKTITNTTGIAYTLLINQKALKTFTDNITFNYSVMPFFYKFQDSAISKTINSTDYNVTLLLDNRSTLINATVDISGNAVSSNYPYNTRIYSGNKSYYFLVGYLVGNYIYKNDFIYDSVTYKTANVTFSSGDTKYIYVNVSTASLNLSSATHPNISFKVTGFVENEGGNVDAYEFFQANDTAGNDIDESKNTNADAPKMMYDNFQNSYTDGRRWIFSEDSNGYFTSGGGTHTITGGYYDLTYRKAAGVFHYPSAWGKITSNDIDFSEVSFVSSNMYMGTNSGWETNSIELCDSSNCLSVYSETASGNSFNVLFNRTNTSSDSWLVYKSNLYISTLDTSTLNDEQKWNISFKILHSPDLPPQYYGWWVTPSSIIASIYVYDLEIGGASLDSSDTSTNYPKNGSITSMSLITATKNISSAYLEYANYTPSSANLTMYLSNNNGTNWEVVSYSGQKHSFASVGNKLAWRANFNTSNVNESPMLLNARAYIIAGDSMDSLTIDYLGDGTSDFVFTGALNSSTTPINISINGSQTISYIITNCKNQLTCKIPIGLTTPSSGYIQVNNMNISLYEKQIGLPTSDFETCDKCKLNFSFTNGSITVSNIWFNFYGDQDMDIFVYKTADSSKNSTRQLWARYSKFNLSFPVGIYWWDFFPSSNNQSNVTPYGQSNYKPIFNVTGQAYTEDMDIFVRANETIDSCMNISMDDVYYRGSETYLNTTSKEIISNLDMVGKAGIWNWIDLHNCSSYYYMPFFYISAICDGCVQTFDFDQTNILVR